MPDAFFTRDGSTWVPSVYTRGPWAEDAQHGGPPTALLGVLLQRLAQANAPGPMQIVRVTAELLKPVPISPLVSRVELTRPGKRVQLLEGALSADGVDMMRVRAVAVRTTELRLPESARASFAAPLPGPERASPAAFYPVPWTEGYHTGMEWRFISGGFTEVGPAVAWSRMKMPLIEGEPIEPLARALIAADSGNGVSGAVDYRKWIYINPDLTVHLHRLPRGEWVALDARTVLEPHGVGLAESILHDEGGPLGRGLQSLLVEAR